MVKKPRKKTTKRKSPVGRATAGAKKLARYVVSATFKMKSTPITKAQADRLAKRSHANGGTVTVKKV